LLLCVCVFWFVFFFGVVGWVGCWGLLVFWGGGGGGLSPRRASESSMWVQEVLVKTAQLLPMYVRVNA